MTQTRADAQQALGGGESSPLNLIHTNNCSKSLSMRVSDALTPVLVPPIRTVVYFPLESLSRLPAGPLQNLLFLRRLTEQLDAPLWRALIRRATNG
jgi:hypothetical protein